MFWLHYLYISYFLFYDGEGVTKQNLRISPSFGFPIGRLVCPSLKFSVTLPFPNQQRFFAHCTADVVRVCGLEYHQFQPIQRRRIPANNPRCRSPANKKPKKRQFTFSQKETQLKTIGNNVSHSAKTFVRADRCDEDK